MKDIIIGISGVAGSGKDTLADYLVAKHGFIKISHADYMKRICKELFDFSDEQLWGPSEYRGIPDKRYPRQCSFCNGRGKVFKFFLFKKVCLACEGTGISYLTVRECLQELGTKWGRGCHPDIWTNYIIRTIKKLQTGYYTYDIKLGLVPLLEKNSNFVKVVVPDLRFRNEIMTLKHNNGYLVRIIKPGAGLKNWARFHQSELEQLSISDDEFHTVIHNNSDISNLYITIEYKLQKIL